MASENETQKFVAAMKDGLEETEKKILEKTPLIDLALEAYYSALQNRDAQRALDVLTLIAQCCPEYHKNICLETRFCPDCVICGGAIPLHFDT